MAELQNSLSYLHPSGIWIKKWIYLLKPWLYIYDCDDKIAQCINNKLIVMSIYPFVNVIHSCPTARTFCLHFDTDECMQSMLIYIWSYWVSIVSLQHIVKKIKKFNYKKWSSSDDSLIFKGLSVPNLNIFLLSQELSLM